jgi:hypothetical protein
VCSKSVASAVSPAKLQFHVVQISWRWMSALTASATVWRIKKVARTGLQNQMVNAFDFNVLRRRTSSSVIIQHRSRWSFSHLRSLAGLCAWETRWNHTDWNAFDDEKRSGSSSTNFAGPLEHDPKLTWVHYREAGLQEVAASRQVAAFSESATIERMRSILPTTVSILVMMVWGPKRMPHLYPPLQFWLRTILSWDVVPGTNAGECLCHLVSSSLRVLWSY